MSTRKSSKRPKPDAAAEAVAHEPEANGASETTDATATDSAEALEAAVALEAVEELGSNELDAAADPADDELMPEEPPVETPKTREQLKHVLESLIFVSDDVITAQQLARIVKSKAAEVREIVLELMKDYEGRGIEIVELANGFQYRSAALSAPFVRDLVAQKPVRLTRAQLETLALVAYRQPITRPEIDDVRGVDSGSALKVLLERGLLKILGRKDEPGRPLLYGTAPYFLEFFGMKGMQDLPTLREFTDLNEENRALFQRKTGEIPESLTEPTPVASAPAEAPAEDASFDDDELMAIAEAAKHAASDADAIAEDTEQANAAGDTSSDVRGSESDLEHDA